MDFVVGLPRTKTDHDAIWVIMDRLTKSTLFLVIHKIFSLDRLARLYIDEIVKLHRVSMIIVSDQDLRFTSRFWPRLQKALDTTCTSVLLSICKLMVSLKRPSRLWKTCYGHEYWIFKGVGFCICLWLSSPTITIIKLELAWLFTRLFMGEDIRLLYVEMR